MRRGLMYRKLGDAQLKTGETVEIGLITAPFDVFAERLRKLLGHKGWEWVWQVDWSLAGKTDELENRFYVARRGEDILSNVCTFETRGVGILGHVWTPEAERRKGLCNAIFERLMDEYRARGGGLLLLNTAFDTPPWHIYKRFGFVEYYEGSGCMRYSTDADFEKEYFAPGRAKVVEPTWAAWPTLNALAAESDEHVKSVAYRRFGKTFLEDVYLWLLHAMEEDASICTRLLESESTGATVGYAWAVPDRYFPGVYLLDLYSHPNHPDGYGKLLGAMRWPAGKVTTYVEARVQKKAAALEAAAFKREGTLNAHLKRRDGAADLVVYSRGTLS